MRNIKFRVFLFTFLLVYKNILPVTNLEEGPSWRYGDFLARIVKVVDGDSLFIEPDQQYLSVFHLKEREEFRMIGVNAEEMTDLNQEKRLRAHLQRDFTFYFLNNKVVMLRVHLIQGGGIERDKYNRILGYIFFDGGRSYQELALERGFLKGFYSYPFDRTYQKRFRWSERRARESKRGLYWSNPKEIALSDVNMYAGTFVTIQFKICHVHCGRRNIFLDSDVKKHNVFSVVIPLDYARYFSKDYCNCFRELYNRTVKVTGFLGMYRGKYQLRLYQPAQLTVNPGR
jgi:endonuclease YncB( thermonuclease family)